jgi:hypothetical protein
VKGILFITTFQLVKHADIYELSKYAAPLLPTIVKAAIGSASIDCQNRIGHCCTRNIATYFGTSPVE